MIANHTSRLLRILITVFLVSCPSVQSENHEQHELSLPKDKPSCRSKEGSHTQNTQDKDKSSCRSKEGSHTQNTQDNDIIKRFKASIKESVDKFVSLRVKDKKDFSCIICVNGDVIYKNNFEPDELICMGSITKQFTAYLLFEYLIKHHKDTWQEIVQLPIAKIPQIQDWCRSMMKNGQCSWMNYVTLDDLLSHKSGMLKMEKFKSRVFRLMVKNFFSPIKPEEMLKYFICDDSLRATKKFLYSDVNYIIITLIIEKLYGKSYTVLINELAIRYGLKSLQTMPDKTISKVIKTMPGMHKFKQTKYFPVKFCYGTGSLCANIIDINKWGISKYTDEIYNLMSKPRSYSTDIYYGYGLFTNYDSSSFWHVGRYYQFCSARTHSIYYKNYGVVVTLSIDGDKYFRDMCDIVDNVHIDIHHNK